MLIKMREITRNEDKAFDIIIEKSRLNREKSMLVLNKSLLLYFTFLFVGIMGFVYGFVTNFWLNLLIIMGLCVLIIGTLPYIRVIYEEEKKLDKALEDLRKRK